MKHERHLEAMKSVLYLFADFLFINEIDKTINFFVVLSRSYRLYYLWSETVPLRDPEIATFFTKSFLQRRTEIPCVSFLV